MLRSELILDWIQGPRVLDVGCAAHVPEPGNPYWVHGRLRERFPEVVGIDINEENIKLLKGRGFSNIFVASAESFALDGKFNTVFSGELIEHLSNPGLFLDRTREHLAPGGRVILTTPNPFSILYSMYAFMKYPKTCKNLEHTCWFCVQTLTELTRRAGLKVTHWELIEDYRLDDPSWLYRTFVRLMACFRWIIPRRLKNNTMLFVLERDSSGGSPTQ